MKKILLVSFILALAMSAFAFNLRNFWTEIRITDGDILEYVSTSSDSEHDEDFSIVVTDVATGDIISTDTNTANITRVTLFANFAWVVFDAQGFPTTGNVPEGRVFQIVLTYLGNDDPDTNSATFSVTAPSGTGPVYHYGDVGSWFLPQTMFLGDTPTYTLAVGANYPGAAIYLDGADTGQVTPYTFDPAEAGTYTLVMDNVVWTPADYIYAAEANAEVYFTGVYGPNAPNVTAPTEGQVFEWTEPGTVDVVWDLDPMVDYYEVKFMEEEWVAVAEGNTMGFDIAESGNYHVSVRGVKNDPAPTKIYTKARISDRGANTSAAKGTGAETMVNFEVVITPVVDDVVINPDVELPANVTVGGAVPPELIGTDTGLPAQIYTITDTGTKDVTLFRPATWGGIDWYAFLVVGGSVISGANPISAPSYTFVDVNFDAKGEVVAILNDNETLPVELSVFNAVLTAQKFVKLTWVSESETGMLGYKVYRSQSNDVNSAIVITPSIIEATNTSTTQVYTHEDNEVLPFNSYYYWLEAVDYASSEFYGPQFVEITGEVAPELPVQTAMKSAYPNPFKANSNTTIEVAVKAGETGNVTIYNVLGQVVKTYKVSEGTHNLEWNGRDNKGNACGSGIYFYKLSSPSMNQTKKMVIVK